MRIRDFEISPVLGHELVQVQLHVGDGLSGCSIASASCQEAITRFAERLVVGKDPRAVSAIWDDCVRAENHFPSAQAALARAALDIACWDLKARINQEPLWKTLGGTHSGAVAYASVRQPILTEGPVMDAFAALVSAGNFRQGLLRLGENSDLDMPVLNRMSRLLSQQAFPFDIMLDFGGVPADQAIERIGALEQSFDITWVKGVSDTADPQDIAKVSGSITAAVCAGGECFSESDFLPLLNPQCANVIEIDVQYLGITGTLRVADAAFGYELPVTLKSAPGNLPVHVASVLPNFMGMEVVDMQPVADHVAGAASFAAGRAWASQQPGTGIAIVSVSAA